MVNWVLIISTDLLILRFWGFKSLLYLALGSLFAGGIHPLAGHLLAEHYVFEKVGWQAGSSWEALGPGPWGVVSVWGVWAGQRRSAGMGVLAWSNAVHAAPAPAAASGAPV